MKFKMAISSSGLRIELALVFLLALPLNAFAQTIPYVDQECLAHEARVCVDTIMNNEDKARIFCGAENLVYQAPQTNFITGQPMQATCPPNHPDRFVISVKLSPMCMEYARAYKTSTCTRSDASINALIDVLRTHILDGIKTMLDDDAPPQP